MTPAHTQAHQTSALEAIKELLEANFLEAEKSADDEGRFSISFRVVFDRSHPQTMVKVTSRVSHAVTDEIELRVSDPNQPDLDLGRGQTQQALCGS
jgi:hypothetical protein